MADSIKFNSAGFRAILLGGGTKSAVQSAAQQVAARGHGLEVRSRAGSYGGGRQIAFVRTTATTPAEAEIQRETLESII